MDDPTLPNLVRRNREAFTLHGLLQLSSEIQR